MSTKEKDGGIPEFSADYRQVRPVSAGRKPAGNRRPSVPAQPETFSGRAENSAGAGQKPPRQDGLTPSSVPYGGPKRTEPAPRRPGRPQKKTPPPQAAGFPADTLENDTEIDDFLPAADRADGEQMLTKWDETAGAAVPASARPKKRGKYRYGILVGALVMIFALIGVGYIATSIGTAIHARLTDDSSLRAYDKFLTVVVAQDPKPFASPDKADPDFVLNASLWQTMTAEGANYTSYDDAGRTIVPLGDVADACRDLFGPDCSLQPKNPTEETFFEYDSAKAQFHVALYSIDSTYVPYTQSARRDGDSTVLRVGYIPPSDPTRAESSAAPSAMPTPAKVMEYVLKTNPATQKEYIYAIRTAA